MIPLLQHDLKTVITFTQFIKRHNAMKTAALQSDVAEVFEQVHESMGEYFDLIERNNEIAASFLLLERHCNGAHYQFERAVFACSRVETEIHREQRIVKRFPGKVGNRAASKLADLLECLERIRGLL